MGIRVFPAAVALLAALAITVACGDTSVAAGVVVGEGVAASSTSSSSSTTSSSASLLETSSGFCFSCYEKGQLQQRRRAEAARAHHQRALNAERAVANSAAANARAHRSREAAFRRERMATMAAARRDAARAKARLAGDRARSDRALSASGASRRAAERRLAAARAREAARRRALSARQMSRKCARLDCGNPKWCFNRANVRIPSGRASKAVRRGERWYQSDGSVRYWSKCAWVESVPKCHPTNPTLERHGTRWVKRPYRARKNFVRRAGRWYRSATSNEFYDKCRWVRTVARKNCKDPSVRWLAGRWVPRSRAERSKYRKVGGRWYLGTNTKFVYRNCRWVLSESYKAKHAARALARREGRLVASKKAVSKWRGRWRNYLAKDYDAWARKHPIKAAVNKVTYADTHALVSKIVPRIADEVEQRMAARFIEKYIPTTPEKNRPRARRAAGRAAARVHPLHASTNGGQTMFVNEFDPEPNGSKEDRYNRARQSTYDFEEQPQQWVEDPSDPERGVSGGSEPGKQFRNVGKNADQMLHVVGEEEMLRNPVDANDQALQAVHPERDPSLARV